MDDDSDVPTEGLMAYDQWIDEALRSVVRRALTFVAENGLLGDHHIYLTFKTAAPGVGIAGYLRSQHPDDMTIVLQHQFSDLDVGEESVGVTLRFSGKPERLIVPFSAVTGFADPSVNFGLQLKPDVDGANDTGDLEDAGVTQDIEADDIEPASETDVAEAAATEVDGNVVALDTFRKS